MYDVAITNVQAEEYTRNGLGIGVCELRTILSKLRKFLRAQTFPLTD